MLSGRYTPVDMDRLGSILPGVLHRRGLHRPAQAASVVLKAETWLRTALPAHAAALHPTAVRSGVLEIDFANGVAAQECRLVLPDLLRHLQNDLPSGFLRDVRLCRRG